LTFNVELSRAAERDLLGLPSSMIHRVDAALSRMKEEPRPVGALKLHGKTENGWRVRVGDYRILYTIDVGTMTVRVYRIEHRQSVYKKRK